MGDFSGSARPARVEDDQYQPSFDEESAEERQRVRCRVASRLLWGRLSELEELRNELERLSEVIGEVARLQNSLIHRVDEQMAVVLDCATTTHERRQVVKDSFSTVLNDAIQRLRD